VAQFVDGVPAQIDDLREALQARDAESARLIAHRIRGAAGIFAKQELSDRALDVEEAARCGDLSAARELTDVLAESLQDFLRSREGQESQSQPSAGAD